MHPVETIRIREKQPISNSPGRHFELDASTIRKSEDAECEIDTTEICSNDQEES